MSKLLVFILKIVKYEIYYRKKISMTQKFDENGNVVPVTMVQAGPCVITQVKNTEKDGYQAVQVGYGEKNSLHKPQVGHLKAVKDFFGKKYPLILKEFPLNDVSNKEVGQVIDVNVFNKGEKVAVTGFSKGRGFAGVVKRHGFHGSPGSHGHKDQLRMPGSIGATGPARVFKGTKMGGRMGNDQVTVKNLEIIDIDEEKNIIYISGPIPGARNSFIYIKCDGEMELKNFTDVKKEEVKEEIAKETPVKVEEKKEKEEVKEEVPKVEVKEEKTTTEEKVAEEVKKEDKKVEDKKAEDKSDASAQS